MIPIKAVLDKIQWDKREDPKDYGLGYKDRFKKDLVMVRLSAIERDGSFFRTVDDQGKEVAIPLHRIRQVVKNGVVVWERP